MIRKVLGWAAVAAGTWMLVSPQALMGLKELRWMHNASFQGEVLAAVFVLALGYYLLDRPKH